MLDLLNNNNKALLLVETGEKIVVQFNPNEYKVTNSVKYSDHTIPGSDKTISQFISGESPVLTMEFLFDTYKYATPLIPVETGTDVTEKTRKIVELTHIKGSLHRPPIVTFIWGSVSFRGIITNVSQQFLMFLPGGKPVRAKLEVTFKAVNDDFSMMKSPLESPDRTKYKTVSEGEYLWNYANEEYDSPDMWRVIAKANGIMNPLDIRPGQMLKIPALRRGEEYPEENYG